jgi:uncharacterized repeat protein (TIGR03803 family)
MKRARWTRDVMTAIAYLAVTIFVGTITVPIAEAQSIERVGTFSGPSHPDTGLIQGTDILLPLYGTTGGGGNDLVFKVPLNGTPFTPIHTLQCATEGCAGADSLGALIQIGNLLYGTRTNGGSPNDGGTIFQVNVDTMASIAIHVFQVNAQDAFTNDGSDGRVPLSGLILSDGFLYGTTLFGGASNQGAAYRIRPNGSEFSIIHSFNCVSDSNCAYVPASGMIQLSDGFLYGTTVGGAGLISGTIYKLSTDGATFQILHTFTDDTSGSVGSPFAGLVQGSDGFLYGTTANSGLAAAGTVYKIFPDGTQFLTIHPFTGSPNDGGLPLARLIQLSDFNFYGTTQRGGANDCGTVFRISPSGVFELIDSFALTNGCFPGNALILASDGNLYGTAPSGGTGFGTIFRVNVKQTPVITWSNPADITYPTALSGTQLNATANIAGVFVYTPASGTVLNAGNGQTLHVNFTPTDTVNYNNASKDALINVLRATTTIQISNIPASASVGGFFTAMYTYIGDGTPSATSNTPGTCTASGNLVNFIGAGTCTLLAHASTGSNYASVDGSTQSFAIAGLNFALSLTKNGTGSGTVTSNPAGINCGGTCSAVFIQGTSVTLTATALSGSSFAGWSGEGCSGTSTCTVSMTVARNVTATFNLNVVQFTLTVARNGTGSGTVTSNPAGVNCGSTCSALFNQGTSVTLTATAESGSSFAGWSGEGCSGNGTCTVSMTVARNVTAMFNVTSVSGLRFVPVSPCRVMDTRLPTGPLGGPFLAGGSTRSVPLPTSTCGIPATAAAYSLNVTVVPRSGTLGYLTIWPTGPAQPLVSTLNSPDGSILANAAIVPAGTAGSINVFVTDNTDLIIDINGYFATTGALQFYSLTPCRVLDTRNPGGTFGGPTIAGGTSRSFPIPASTCGVPAAAAAYSFNTTVVPSGSLGYLTAWPTGSTQPFVSTLNSLDGTILANAAIVPAGTAGAVSFFASNTTDLIVDINGYFAAPGAGGLDFHTVVPCRIADTRNPTGPLGGPILSAGTTRTFPVLSSACALPATAAAYSLNMLAVPSGLLGYLTTWPTGSAQPFVSTLNAPKGLMIANAAIVPAGISGSVNVFVTHATHVIIDVDGYFGP